MGYTIPEHSSDEVMEYVIKLNDRFSCIDDEYYDNGWDLHFLNRLKNGKIDPPFKYEAFLDNEDIIATLEGYELDVEKFWFVLLFIYDMTMDRALSSAEFRKSDYEVLTEIKEYLEKHATPAFTYPMIGRYRKTTVVKPTILL